MLVVFLCAVEAAAASATDGRAPQSANNQRSLDTEPVFPWEWKTAGSRLYSFCSNASGPLSPLAVANLARSKVMIHGMEVGAEIEPRWQNSEYKTWLAAQQLRAMAPEQLQLYTVQIDFARSVYKSGEWFNQHKECVLNATDGYPVMNNASKPTKFPDNIGHCNQKPDIPGRSYPYGGCYVYGFNTKCGREKWTSFITDACEEYDLDGVFIDGFQGCGPYTGSCGRCLNDVDKATAAAWLKGLNESLWALHKNFTTGKNAQKPKKIICNRTGQTYDCDEKTKTCYCSASNDERWGGGDDGVVALTSYASAHPSKGVVVHVPHVAVDNGIFNSSLASFLLGANDGDGYGIGFGYDCDTGGWLKWDADLDKPLGQPMGPATNTSNIWRRSFASGVKVYMNATPSSKGARLATCIRWADGATTARNGGCDQMDDFEEWKTGTEGSGRHQSPPTCNLVPGHDLICHNVTRGGKGPRGHYAVWCDDLVQLPCISTEAAPCDACTSLHGCHALCVKNATNGGKCTAWSYNHQHQLCYLKGLADLPANGTYRHVTGKPAISADTSGRLWNYTAMRN